MSAILVIYATRYGQTRRIAEAIGSLLAVQQLPFDRVDAAKSPADFTMEKYSAAILAASVHIGKHEPEMLAFVKCHRAELERIPALFLSVSLAAANLANPGASPAKRAEAQTGVKRPINGFLAKTGWHPTRVEPVAGSLAYTRYNFAVRLIMRYIAGKVAMPVDTSKDYEFTNWKALDRIVNDFIAATGAWKFRTA